ncbi:hypothetical protein [Gordonia sp. (in: high G+C Gram-positive bacteria)]|uniref:hypothetical protein n=1 Tax=Gordonia sp. (in: high G+C Gram-positive bacteria) TaxID=84139 RepID=UPI003C764B1B
MSSEIQELAGKLQSLVAVSTPGVDALAALKSDCLSLHDEVVAAAMPDVDLRRAADLLSAAGQAATKAAGHLDEFGRGGGAFADRLARAETARSVSDAVSAVGHAVAGVAVVGAMVGGLVGPVDNLMDAYAANRTGDSEQAMDALSRIDVNDAAPDPEPTVPRKPRGSGDGR